MNLILSALVVVGLFSSMVFIHELGHYFFARLFGVKIEQFSIGFGKKLISLTDKKGTIWKICAIPLGGYLKIKGEQADNKNKNQDKDSLINKNFFQKFLIILGGPLANYIFAYFIIASVFYAIPMIQYPPIINDLEIDGPAFKAGLIKGDEIISINSSKIKDFQNVREALFFHDKNKEIKITIKRNEEIIIINIMPEIRQVETIDGNLIEVPFLGVGAGEGIETKRNILQSSSQSIVEVFKYSFLILKSIKMLLFGEIGKENMSSVIGIAKTSKTMAEQGFVVFSWYAAMLSINLATINLLPIMPLDGGLIFQLILDKILFFSQSARDKIKKYSYVVGMSFILLVFAFAIYNDILKIYISTTIE